MSILESRCGKKWGIDLEGIQYTLTGLDIDENALVFRNKTQQDLDISIHGDLRTVVLEDNNYDVIYNSNVLEHIKGAEGVLGKIIRWLKPGGTLILIIPNRDSAKGFVTRITPFWFHIFYKRYIKGRKNAGRPNYSPYPTFFDKVVSRRGIHEFCEGHGLFIKAEYSSGHGRNPRWIARILSRVMVWILFIGSFGSLSARYSNLIYIIEKP